MENGAATFEGSFMTLSNADADSVIHSSQVTLPALTSMDAEARDRSSKAKQTLREVGSMTPRDVTVSMLPHDAP